MFGELRSPIAVLGVLVACGARSELDESIAASDAGNEHEVGTADVAREPCTPTLLIDHVTATSLWLDGDYVYFASQSRGIGRISKSGGSILTYTTDPTSFHVTTDDAYVYWTADCCVAREPKTGKGLEVLTGSNNLALGALALDATNVYFVDRTSGLWRVPKTGGNMVQLANLGMGPMGLVLSDGSLFAGMYWPPGGVVRTALDGTGLTSIVSADNSSTIVADATSIYWITQDRVLESRHDGSGFVVHGAGGQPEDIAIDDTKVYWTDIAGTIFSADKGSSVSTGIAVGGILRNIAVDDQCVYYSTNCCAFSDGQIIQRPK